MESNDKAVKNRVPFSHVTAIPIIYSQACYGDR